MDVDNIRELVAHVLDSDVVVLLQTEKVLFSPRCLLELYAAATAGIPIVSLVCSGKGYDFAAAEDHLLHLDTSLPASTVGVLEAHEAPVLRVAQVLWACLPNIASVPLNSSGNEDAIRAAVANLVKTMQHAVATPVVQLDDTATTWLEDRMARDKSALTAVITSSTGCATQRERMLQRISRVDMLEREVAELKAALARNAE